MSEELPSGWKWCIVGEISDFVTSGSRDWSKFYSDKGAYFVRSAEINDYTLRLSEAIRVALPGKVEGKRTLIEKGDILVTITGANVGKCAKVDKDIPEAYVSQSVALIKITDNRITPFVYYALRAQNVGGQQLAEMAYGVGRPVLSLPQIRSIRIPLAPLTEQQRIVRMLQQGLDKANVCQRRLERIPILLQRFRQSVLATACSGRLTAQWREMRSEEQSWVCCKLSKVGEVSGGITKNSKRKSEPMTLPYLRVANVYENRLVLDEVHSIGITQKEFERTRLEKGDILFVEGNGSIDQIGRVALWDCSISPCVHQNHLIKFRSNGRVIPEYVLLQMMAPAGRAQLMEKSISSAGLNTLSISKISDVELQIAPKAEQEEIVRRTYELFALADKIEARYKVVQQQVDRLPQSILAKAFRGELVSTEAELAEREGRSYESVEELLNCIRESREHIPSARVSDPRTSLSNPIIDGISLDGFSEPITIDELHQTRCRKVPEKSGIYVIIRPSDSAPRFLRKSTGGVFKGLDPSYPFAVVRENWVEGAHVVYVGMTAADGGLRSRLGQFFDFGAGKRVGHRGGRLLWHLQDSGELQVRWRTCAANKADSAEDDAIASFKSAHDGRRPFANMIK